MCISGLGEPIVASTDMGRALTEFSTSTMETISELKPGYKQALEKPLELSAHIYGAFTTFRTLQLLVWWAKFVTNKSFRQEMNWQETAAQASLMVGKVADSQLWIEEVGGWTTAVSTHATKIGKVAISSLTFGCAITGVIGYGFAVWSDLRDLKEAHGRVVALQTDKGQAELSEFTGRIRDAKIVRNKVVTGLICDLAYLTLSAVSLTFLCIGGGANIVLILQISASMTWIVTLSYEWKHRHVKLPSVGAGEDDLALKDALLVEVMGAGYGQQAVARG